MNNVGRNREKKQKIVAELSEKVKKAKALVFANYAGMTHVQLERLKKALKNTNADLIVTKNTLLGRALQISNFSPRAHLDSTKRGEAGKFQISSLKEPTATLFAYEDVIAPLKEFAKTIKSLKLPVIKFGIFENREISADEILKLATLPSREVLLSQLAFTMKSPIYGLHKALNWNMQKLVMTIKTIENSKK